MPQFMIIGYDVEDSAELRKQVRPAHVERLKKLESEGRLILAGPNPIEHGKNAMTGSLIVAEFDSIDALKDWVSGEPYLTSGVYSHVDIKPFIKTLPSS